MNSASKILYHRDRIETFKKQAPVMPLKVQIDPVAFCNHDCSFCTYRYTQTESLNALFDQKDMLSLTKIIEILDDCVDIGVKAVELTGGGEPSLHPAFCEILEAICSCGLDLGLITNGAWREKDFDRIIRLLDDAKWVRFSLDAATAETHKIIHVSQAGDFEKACQAIESLKSPVVGISCVVQRRNIHEIGMIAELAETLNADYVRYVDPVFETDAPTGFGYVDPGVVNDKIVESIQRSKLDIYNEFSDRVQLKPTHYDAGSTCYYSHLTTAIGADAKLYLCCIWKYRPEGLVADLNTNRFRDVWGSEKIKKALDRLNIADSCRVCDFKPKNDFIHNVLNGDTLKHINFV